MVPFLQQPGTVDFKLTFKSTQSGKKKCIIVSRVEYFGKAFQLGKLQAAPYILLCSVSYR